MTVKELIEKLQQFDWDLPIEIQYRWFDSMLDWGAPMSEDEPDIYEDNGWECKRVIIDI